jgi:hypothetical protein
LFPYIFSCARVIPIPILHRSAQHGYSSEKLGPLFAHLSDEIKQLRDSQKKLKLEFASKDSQTQAREDQYEKAVNGLQSELTSHKIKVKQLAQIVQGIAYPQ